LFYINASQIYGIIPYIHGILKYKWGTNKLVEEDDKSTDTLRIRNLKLDKRIRKQSRALTNQSTEYLLVTFFSNY